MQENKPRINFWIGNAFLVTAMVFLLFMGRIWEQLGAVTMLLWIALVIAGVYFVLKDNDAPNLPG